jgi:hypothetical protein
VKYLFKYVNKGYDCAQVGFQNSNTPASDSQTPPIGHSRNVPDQGNGIDEIEEYIRSRYLSSCEAFWRLLGFSIHGKFSAVECLCVHLPGMNLVTVHDESELSGVIENDDSNLSQLTEWFVANQNVSLGHDLTYNAFPQKFTWDPCQKKWKQRQQGFKLGRLRYVHPTAGETFFLHMLLTVVRGAKSYEEVSTYRDVVHPTFRDACHARGLIGDDTEWVSLFDEAVFWATPWQLRCLFMTILIYSKVGNVRVLFDAYWRYMADDVAYRLKSIYGGVSSVIPDTVLIDGLMRQLAELFSSNGTSVTSFGLPLLASPQQPLNRLIMEEMLYNQDVVAAKSARL